jgi:type I restriction enzyme S subunit
MGTIGRSCVVPDEIPTSINTKHLAAITLDRTICLPEFLSSVFIYLPHIQQQMSLANRGAIMDGLNLSIIKNLKISLPPIEVQKEFVRKNHQLLTINNMQEQDIQFIADLNKSLIQKAFKGELVT